MTNVYDIAFPTPPSLYEIATLKVAAILIQRAISKFRAKCSIESRYISWKHWLKLNSNILNLPVPASVLKNISHKYGWMQLNILDWLRSFWGTISDFDCYIAECCEILLFFDNFSYDFDSRVHPRTAKALIDCDNLSVDAKFQLSCLFCFEENVVAFWPKVSKKCKKEMSVLRLRQSDELRPPNVLTFWVYRMKQKLPKLFRLYGDFDLRILQEDNKLNTYSLLYFWNRLSDDGKLDSAIALSSPNDFRAEYGIEEVISVARFIIHRLKEENLAALIAKNVLFLFALIEFSVRCLNYDLLINAFLLVRNKLTEKTFSIVFYLILDVMFDYTLFRKNQDAVMEILCELFRCAPHRLKKSIIDFVITFTNSENDPIHERNFDFTDVHLNIISKPVVFCFLEIIIKESSPSDRRDFWLRNWPALIKHQSKSNFQVLLHLCLNKRETIEFKKDELWKYHNLEIHCEELIRKTKFAEIDEFLNFYSSKDERTITTIKSNLMSSILKSGDFSTAVHWINATSRNENEVKEKKLTCLRSLRKFFVNGCITLSSVKSLHEFILWCCGGNETNVKKFKTYLPYEKIFKNWQNRIKRCKTIKCRSLLWRNKLAIKKRKPRKIRFPHIKSPEEKSFSEFLQWYFLIPGLFY